MMCRLSKEAQSFHIHHDWRPDKQLLILITSLSFQPPILMYVEAVRHSGQCKLPCPGLGSRV